MNGKNIIIGILAVTTIASSSAAAYFGLNKAKEETTKTEPAIVQNQNENENEISNEDEGYERLFRLSNEIKVVNTEDHFYNIIRKSSPAYGVYATLENDTTVEIVFGAIPEGWNYDGSENYTADTTHVKIEFGERKVQNVYNAQHGHTDFGNSILFLMEDGTVEYMPLAYAIKNNDFRSYGKIDGVENVVDIISATTHTSEPASGYLTTLLVQKDGTAYDISEQLRKISEQYKE